MRDLDRTKKYDLSQLNDEQLQAVFDWLKDNDKFWDHYPVAEFKTGKTIFFDGYEWMFSSEDPVNAIELFNDESDVYKIARDLVEKGKQQGLKVVVTFEKL